jgi:hypothetical protein
VWLQSFALQIAIARVNLAAFALLLVACWYLPSLNDFFQGKCAGKEGWSARAAPVHWAAGSDLDELRYHPAGSAEGGIIQPGKIVLDRPRGVGGNVLDAPLLSRHRALLVGIGLNQAGINGKPFATHQAFGHALAHHKERSSSEPPLLGIEAVRLALC